MKRKRELLDTTRAPDTNDSTNNENNNIITTPKRLCQASSNTIATSTSTTSTSSSSSHTIITNNTSSRIQQHNHHESSSSTSDGGGGASDWTMLAPNCLTNIFNFLSIHANHEAHATATTTTPTTPTFPILQQQQQHHNNNNNDRHSMMMMSDPLVDPLWIVKYHSQALLLTRHVHFSYESLVQLYQRNELWKFRFVLKNANSVSFHLHSLCSLCSLMNKRRLQRQQQQQEQQQQLMSYNNNDNEDITSGIMTQGHFRQACLILDTIARALTENLGLETLHIRTSCCKDNLSVIAPPPPPIPTLFPAQTTAKHSTTNTTKNNGNVSNDYHDDNHDIEEKEEDDVKQWKCTVVSTKRLMMMAIAPMDYLIHQWTKYISRYNHHKQSNNSDFKTNSSSNSSSSRNRIKSGNSLRVISCQGSQSSQSLSELVRSFPNLCSLTYHCCSFSALDKDAFLPQLMRPTIRHVDLSTISNVDDGLVRVLIRMESLRWLTINTSHLSVDTVHEICASSQLRALEFSLHRLDDKSYEILRDNSTLELLRFPSIYEAKNLRTVLMNRGSLRQITANSSVDLDEDTLDPLKDNNTLEVLDISGSIVVNCLPLIHTCALKSICIGDEGDITVQEMVEAMGQDWFDALTVESFHLKSRYPIHFGNLLRERLPQRIVLVVDDFYSQDTGEEM